MRPAPWKAVAGLDHIDCYGPTGRQRNEPADRKMLVLKSAAHYRAAFDPIAALTIEVGAPGLTSPDYRRFEFKKIRRPMYPIDDMPLDAYPAD